MHGCYGVLVSRRLAFLCTLTLSAQTHENLHATLWMQTSVEYSALVTQAYRAVRLNLAAALKNKNWTAALEQPQSGRELRRLPRAVILDLDETVLDNSPFQAGLIRDNVPFTEERFAAWVAEARATALPGAAEMLEFVRSRKVEVFYITNRVCRSDDPADPTVRVLTAVRFPLAAGHLICKAALTDPSDKSARRRGIAERYRILLMFGDDFNDFIPAPRGGSTEDRIRARRELAARHASYWGERWIVLPNPAYGSWERVFDDSLFGDSLENKRRLLRY